MLLGPALLVVKSVAADPPIPIVHILATDPCAAESGSETATFTVVRDGPTNAPLTVYYGVTGSAQNGVDYQLLSGSVAIPAGAHHAPIVVRPIDDSLVEGDETILIVLIQPLVWPPPYIVCWPSLAFGHIEDNDFPPTNRPPAVALVNPPDGSVFLAPADILLVARASDSDGRVRTVEFFEGANSLGIVTNPPPFHRPRLEAVDLDPSFEVDPEVFPDFEITPPPIDPTPLPSNPFHLLWENVRPGHYTLTAVATDNDGTSTRSAPVDIRVTEPPPHPIVTVVARDPVATEPGSTSNVLDTATFVVRRTGNTDRPLTVFYRLGGTASNGIDYAELPNSVTIAPGERSAAVMVAPLDDNLVEGPESVVITSVPPICIDIFPPPPDCYLVGRHHTARAVIRDNDEANRPPVVAIVRPLDGSVFLAPSDIPIVAQARDYDGRVVSVEFFEGTNSLGVVSNNPALLTAARPPFHLIWSNVPPGHYVLTAEATDNDGTSTRSKPVEIKVVERTLPPVVSIAATDAEAAETGGLSSGNSVTGAVNTATFTVSRTGRPDGPLVVYYSLSGTASNGVDYRMLPGKLLIPSNAFSANIVIEPIDDRLVEGTETVGVTIDPSFCVAVHPAPSNCYLVGESNRAKAILRDNDVAPTNLPPKIAILRPENGDVFVAPADIAIAAEARDADGVVRSVEFFANGESLGVVSNSLSASGISNAIGDTEQIFRLKWPGVGPGGYALTAKATDNRGAMTTSEPVRIRVIELQRPPVVTIETIDKVASEQSPLVLVPVDVAIFQVTRTGPTNRPLDVSYSVGGTAENGLDYRRLSGLVTIPAGSESERIIIEAIDDSLVEDTETVVITLEPPDCIAVDPPPPGCYLVGSPSRAEAFIRDNDTFPPRVTILSPRNGQVFEAPGQIPILVHALDPDGYVTRVEFFEGSNSIGVQEIVFIVAPPPGQLQEFTLRWTDVPAGRYVLTALATDNNGATSRSDPVKISVEEPNPIPTISIIATDPIAREGTTNTATFRIRRSGRTNEALTVHYAIRGTASNGVDYVLIPDEVKIPAGRRSARIVITPIDDKLPERIETVVLHLLEADTYNLGRPRRAAALILDNDHPQPPCLRLPDGLVHLCTPGERGFCYRLEASSDLVNWETLFTSVIAEEGMHFVDADAPDVPRRFLRVLPDIEIPEDE
ncbi:MAG TPA: Calx-beta domain-containing protein [Verrucomicrobiae bacterium]